MFLRTTCAAVVCAIFACAVAYADEGGTEIRDAVREVTRTSEEAKRAVEEAIETPSTRPAMDADAPMPDIEALIAEWRAARSTD